MDRNKCDQLKARLSAQAEPHLVPIEVFFDGNDDRGSIGCNLPNHPGIGVFGSTFLHIAARPDVAAAYAQISEVDPGERCWPFADTVYVVGTIPREELALALAPLEPDEVGPPWRGVPEAIARQHDAPVLMAWWD